MTSSVNSWGSAMASSLTPWDKAECKLAEYPLTHKTQPPLTNSVANPIWNKIGALTVGPRGPMLMQDVTYFDEIGHFDRERIPERVVHAKGGGAHGYFEVTHDITKYTKAVVFEKVGKKTPMFVRFSSVAGESGSPDTTRDVRGFAMKFYTEHGNWDLVANNTPIFFIREPALFPSFIHTQKRNPVTHLKDPNAYWDFWSLRPESLHQVLFLMADRGIPHGWRHMNGYGSHTFKLVNKDNEVFYCKFHIKTDQGIKNITSNEAGHLSGADPDFAIRDLFNHIENGKYPSWTFYIQVMTFEQAADHRWNPFDLTKVWPHGEFPLIQVGKVVLTKNPANYFAEVEQAAFCPAHIIPGIEFSPDKMLQGRLFSYKDTQYHRLGANFHQLPINCPFKVKPHNTLQDGAMLYEHNDGAPNFHPNSFNGPVEVPELRESKFSLSGDVDRYDSGDDDNYTQPAAFWVKVLDEAQRGRTVDNILASLKYTLPNIQKRVVQEFSKVSEDLGERIQAGLAKAQENLDEQANRQLQI